MRLTTIHRSTRREQRLSFCECTYDSSSSSRRAVRGKRCETWLTWHCRVSDWRRYWRRQPVGRTTWTSDSHSAVWRMSCTRRTTGTAATGSRILPRPQPASSQPSYVINKVLHENKFRYFNIGCIVCLPIKLSWLTYTVREFSIFLPRNATQSAVMHASVCRLSVCPSVCLSVTYRYRDHRGWNTSKIISWLISLR